jgi:hypothetical protein
MGVLITSSDPQDIIALFVGERQHDAHVSARKWHLYMVQFDANYLVAIARRQTYKRSIGK